jgi:hypothetical protein
MRFRRSSSRYILIQYINPRILRIAHLNSREESYLRIRLGSVIDSYRKAVVPLRSGMLGYHIFGELIEYSALGDTDYPIPI